MSDALRVWGARLAVAVVAVVSVLIGVTLVVLWPYLRDDYVLDQTVRAVALDWRDFGEDKARERLQYELDARGVGLWVPDQACTLAEAEGTRRVTCAWEVDVALPHLFTTRHLAFHSEAVVTPDGDLR